jgi:hypothetical protein
MPTLVDGGRVQGWKEDDQVGEVQAATQVVRAEDHDAARGLGRARAHRQWRFGARGDRRDRRACRS